MFRISWFKKKVENRRSRRSTDRFHKIPCGIRFGTLEASISWSCCERNICSLEHLRARVTQKTPPGDRPSSSRGCELCDGWKRGGEQASKAATKKVGPAVSAATNSYQYKLKQNPQKSSMWGREECWSGLWNNSTQTMARDSSWSATHAKPRRSERWFCAAAVITSSQAAINDGKTISTVISPPSKA